MSEIVLNEDWVRRVSEVAEAVEARLTPLLQVLVRQQAAGDQAYLSVRQAAALTGLSAKHIRRSFKSGDLPCSNAGTLKRPTYRIARADITLWMESRRLKQGPTKAARQALVDDIFPGAAKRSAPR